MHQDAFKLISQLPANAARDASLHHAIDTAASVLLTFLRAISNERDNFFQDQLLLVASLVNPMFLDCLFRQRTAFRIAFNLVSSDDEDSVGVCWVDDLLAAVGEAVLAVIVGTGYRRCLPTGLESYCAEERIRAATQLPDSWSELPPFLQANDASHGSQRLAIALLYAANVLRPLLDPAQTCNETSIITAGFAQARLDRWWAEPEDIIQAQELAMLVALFAQDDHHRPFESGLRLVPHTTEIINHVISMILQAESSFDSRVAHAVLLDWSAVVPWSWSFLSEDDLNGQLSVILNHNLDRQRRPPNCLVADAPPVGNMAQLSTTLLDDEKCKIASCALGNCLAIVNSQSHTQRICALLVVIATSRPNTVIDNACLRACDVLVQELRTPAGSVALCSTITTLVATIEPPQLARALGSISKWWTKALDLVTLLLPDESRDAASKLQMALDFATLLITGDGPESVGRPHRPLLKPLQSWLLRRRDAHVLRSALQLWALLGLTDACSSTLWDIVLDHGPSNLLLSTSTAQYLAKQGKAVVIDSEEAFDYVRDACLLGLAIRPASEDQPEEYNPVVEAAAIRSYFAALRSILIHMEPDAAYHSLRSPLTEFLFAELHPLLAEQGDLNNRLGVHLPRGDGRRLLNEFQNAARRLNIDSPWTHYLTEKASPLPSECKVHQAYNVLV
ncbi:hypothetical protein BKA62DRAFT_765326 [Auriculariales sp. MPI-PUGE-AT-0066]|nr:hypothetical protein BKA62DRAFT_765326 [Auriculariales sp. MPI-PUGE-AT-0066]